MKKTGKTAFSGIITALSVAALFMTAVIPFFTYILPVFAGILLMLVAREVGRTWAFGTYACVALLSFLVVADKEAVLMYTAFFGYYPIIRDLLEKLPRVAAYAVKLLIFNAAVVSAYMLFVKLFGFNGEEFDEFGRYSEPILLAVANITFFIYDYLIDVLERLYEKKLRKTVIKLFR